ncbi:hypothetical protein N665_0051s0013 [Sinapis alba]|nr:hypothetical protein N665_0051s0013 [Sinapis alba]
MKPIGKSSVPASADSRVRLNQSQAVAMKPNGKSPVSTFNDEEFMVFKDGTVIQGFIPPGRIKKYLPVMKRGSVYRLFNFYGSKSKVVFQVASQTVTVSFSHNSELTCREGSPVYFEEDRFRFHTYEEFESNCDLKGDLYDVVGHMKLVNGHTLAVRPVIDEVEVATTRRVLVHVQSHKGPVMKLYLWDQAATDFCKKLNSSQNTPTVLLVTTVNTKRLGGTLALTSMSSSRVFMDHDSPPTRDYLIWLGTNPEIAKQVNAEVVTKPETLTIRAIYSYIDQPFAKAALLECTATIDDVVHESVWYYIGCGKCKTKETKGPTTLMRAKCEKDDIAGEAQYLANIAVYDKSDQAVFVLLGDAGRQLTGKHASELVSGYFEANENNGDEFQVPVPQALLNTIGQTHKFIMKVSAHNFTGKTRALTITKILPPAAPPSISASEENITDGASEGSVLSAHGVCESSQSCEDYLDEEVKRS